MSEQGQFLETIFVWAFIAMLSACTAVQPTAVETLDETTAASLTYSQTPSVLSPDANFANANERPYIDLGAIEVNLNRNRRYFVWLGIWDINQLAGPAGSLKEFESIILVADGNPIALKVRGWSHEVIGASNPVYKKIFAEAVDAYYEVSLDQIALLAQADRVELHTTGSAPREFIPWYREEKAKADLAEFFRAVTR